MSPAANVVRDAMNQMNKLCTSMTLCGWIWKWTSFHPQEQFLKSWPHITSVSKSKLWNPNGLHLWTQTHPLKIQGLRLLMDYFLKTNVATHGIKQLWCLIWYYTNCQFNDLTKSKVIIIDKTCFIKFSNFNSPAANQTCSGVPARNHINKCAANTKNKMLLQTLHLCLKLLHHFNSVR